MDGITKLLSIVTPYSVQKLNFPPQYRGLTLDTRIYYAAAKLILKDIFRVTLKMMA